MMRKQEIEEEQEFRDLINIANNPKLPDEKTKNTDSWKQLRFMAELQKSGLLPIVDSNLEDDEYYQEFERYRYRLEQLFDNPNYEELDKIKRIYKKVYGGKKHGEFEAGSDLLCLATMKKTTTVDTAMK
jgi:hypothetical protein